MKTSFPEARSSYCSGAEHSCFEWNGLVLGLKCHIVLLYVSLTARRVPSVSPLFSHIFWRAAVPPFRRVSRAVCVFARGWFCQHHNKSPWLSRPCFSRLSSCPGCLASAAGPGRRKIDLTLATPEKVGSLTFVAGENGTQQYASSAPVLMSISLPTLANIPFALTSPNSLCPNRRLHAQFMVRQKGFRSKPQRVTVH